MVRTLAFYVTLLTSIILISSCGLNNHHSINGQGSSIQITSPNNGVSFSTKESASVTIAGICDKGVDVDLVAIPARPVNNNCATDGTWSFETGALSGGPNTFSISTQDCAQLPGGCSGGGNLNNNGSGDGGSITISVIAASMSIRADKTTLSPNGVANLQAIFFDANNAQIMVPAPTTSHHITWTLVSGDADVEYANASAAGEKAIVTAGANTGSITVHAELDSIDEAYGYEGNTGYDITLTVATSTSPTSIPGVATSMTVTADKTTLNAGDTTDLQVHFFDAFGAELVIPEAITDHLITWSSDDITLATVAVSTPVEKAIVTGVSGGSTNIQADLSFANGSYGYTGNTTASINITVLGGENPLWYSLGMR